MNVSTVSFVSVVLLASLHSIWALKCMSCTYTFSGSTGVVDRECVSDVHNFTKTRVIECGGKSKFCTTKAVYVSGYTRLNSLYRGCGYKREKFCDHPSSLIPVCEVTCTTPKCNDQNGDLWQSMNPNPTAAPGGSTMKPKPGGGGDNNGCASLNSSYTAFLILVAITLFNISHYPFYQHL